MRSRIPTSDRLLLGPGPSPVSMAVREALAAPPRSHLDPDLVALLDDVRMDLQDVLQAPDEAFATAISGTGTTAMDAAAANLVEPGMSVLVVVGGYFGDRLAQIFQRYGAHVERLDVEWGRAVDPAAVERALVDGRFDVVAVVHGETSTGVANPIADIAPLVRAREALLVVDAVTTLGAMPVDMREWDADVVYSCGQKGLGAPPGLSPFVISARARAHAPAVRSFALDAAKLEDFWVRRQYHHTISSPLVYALRVALQEVLAEGLDTRFQRHQRLHDLFVEGAAAIGLQLLPPSRERLISLNAVCVPDGVDDKAVRLRLLLEHNIEIGAGLGPLAGRIWRIGLMGTGATEDNVRRVLSALEDALAHTRR